MRQTWVSWNVETKKLIHDKRDELLFMRDDEVIGTQNDMSNTTSH